jgi:tetratricopeptide (TPR) repeat protein
MNEVLNCESCSKESYKTVPLTRLMQKLDELFSKNDLEAVGRLLDYWESEARILLDDRGLLEVLNEKVGYYRRTGDRDRALDSVKEALALIEIKKIGDPVSHGTIYLNCATTMKAFGLAKDAMPYYENARNLLESNLNADDYRIAAFYNNISSAYKELGMIDEAEEACYNAIEILKTKDDCYGEIAVTLINIAHLYHENDPFDERIYEIMDKAWELLNSDKNTRDGDFAFICSKCYPSFGYFGYFEREATLKKLAEEIYAGN